MGISHTCHSVIYGQIQRLLVGYIVAVNAEADVDILFAVEAADCIVKYLRPDHILFTAGELLALAQLPPHLHAV